MNEKYYEKRIVLTKEENEQLNKYLYDNKIELKDLVLNLINKPKKKSLFKR